jgi:Pectate lyase superfamily protein/Right handed beta helix region
MFNVKQLPYGATGDGSADDTQAIRAAIAAAAAAGGGQVYFPEGRYKITGRIEVKNPNIELVGGGRHCSVLECHSTDDSAVVFFGYGNPAGSLPPVNLYGCAIRHLGIKQMVNNTMPHTSLLHIQYVFQFQADSLWLYGTSDTVTPENYAQQLIFAQGTSVYLRHIDGFGAKTSGITCLAQYFTVSVPGSPGSTKPVLYGNDYFLSDITIQMHGIVGRALNLINITEGAVQAVNSSFLTGEQCHISNTAFATFSNCYFDSAQKPVSIDTGSRHVYFSNCEFANRPGGGAMVADAKNVVFANCMVVNNGGSGIELSGLCSDVIIANCIIDGNNTGNSENGSGVYLQSGATNIQINGNRIGNISHDFPGKQKYGIYLAVNGNGVMVNSNNLAGNQSDAIGGGTPTIKYGNVTKAWLEP